MDLREMLESQDLGPIELEFQDGDIVTDVVAILRCQRLDGTSDKVTIGVTESTGGVTQYGMVRAANLQIEDWMVNGAD